ncbi:MAG: hypothetical protein KGI75_05035 [Rhizobiaceae bacterium]|nr:hypothetical protein [Rhizobiaceae bacterium]
MNLMRSSAARALVGCLLLTSCSSMAMLKETPTAPAYDVRSAVVVADAAVPPVSPVLISTLSERVNEAIAATTRDTPLPKVALTIRLASVSKGRGFDKNRNIAKINVDAASVDTGAVIALASFETTTFAADPTAADNLMAEQIAARIRSIFVLKAGQLVN